VHTPVHVDIEPIKPLVTEAAPAQEIGRRRRRLVVGFHEPATAVAEPKVDPLPNAAAASAGHVRDDARVALVLLARAPPPSRGADGDRLGPDPGPSPGQAGVAHGRDDAQPDAAALVEAPPRRRRRVRRGVAVIRPDEDREEVRQGRGRGRRQLGHGAPLPCRRRRRRLLLRRRLMRPHHPLARSLACVTLE